MSVCFGTGATKNKFFLFFLFFVFFSTFEYFVGDLPLLTLSCTYYPANDLCIHMLWCQLGKKQPSVLLCLSRFGSCSVCMCSVSTAPTTDVAVCVCVCVMTIDNFCAALDLLQRNTGQSVFFSLLSATFAFLWCFYIETSETHTLGLNFFG